VLPSSELASRFHPAHRKRCRSTLASQKPRRGRSRMSSGGHLLDIGMATIGVAVVADDGSAGGIAAAASVAGVDRKGGGRRAPRRAGQFSRHAIQGEDAMTEQQKPVDIADGRPKTLHAPADNADNLAQLSIERRVLLFGAAALTAGALSGSASAESPAPDLSAALAKFRATIPSHFDREYVNNAVVPFFLGSIFAGERPILTAAITICASASISPGSRPTFTLRNIRPRLSTFLTSFSIRNLPTSLSCAITSIIIGTSIGTCISA
jgi:hypothetical protein